MKILIISTRLPHARVFSGHFIVYQRVKRLAERGHRVGLVVFAKPEEEEHVGELKPWVHELEIVRPPRAPSPARRLAEYFFSPIPPRFARLYSPEMLRRVGDMVERTRYDVALAEFGSAAQHLLRNPYLPAVRKVVSVHQCQTVAGRRALDLMGFSPRALREWIALKGLQRYEFDIYRCADRVLVLTPEERYGVLSHAPDLRITMIPSGVDTSFFRPGPASGREPALLFTGNFDDEPNRDAVRWFVHDIWPRLKPKRPDLRFYVVGVRPPPDIQDLPRRDPGIVVTGEVEDIRPYLDRSRVFVCPDRMGSGMRGKILQAMASGVPVVCTTGAAEGISIQMGDNGFMADKPRIMAEYIDLLEQVLQDVVQGR